MAKKRKIGRVAKNAVLDHGETYLCRVVNNRYPILNRQYGVGDEVELPGIHAAAFTKDGFTEILGVVLSDDDA